MKNKCFLSCGNMGMGDFLFTFSVGVFLKDKYDHIYIYYGAVHFNGLMYLFNRILEENNIYNITLIGNPIYKDPNCKPPSDKFIYFNDEILSREVYELLTQYKENIELDENNNLYIFLECIVNLYIKSNLENIFSSLYYDIVFDYLNVTPLEIRKSINFKLNNSEKIENDTLYKKLLNSINNEKYILVFHSIERQQYNFTFRDYPNDFNKNNYRIINICKRWNDFCPHKNSELYFDEIMGSFCHMYYLHKIIENAEEIHMIDSFPLHYMLFIINDESIFKKTITYPRLSTGIVVNSDKNNVGFYINNSKVSLLNPLITNMCFKSYYTLNYFKNFDTLEKVDIRSIKDTCGFIHDYYQDLKKRDDTPIDNHYTNFKEIINSTSHCILKVLPTLRSNNNSGIIGKTILNNINFIEINLNKHTDDKHILKNTIDICNEIDELINKINNNFLNILLIRTNGDYILKIDPFFEKINNDIIELDTNSDNIDNMLIEVVDYFIGNKNIHYIFPYKDENDKNNFVEKLKIYSFEMFHKETTNEFNVYKVECIFNVVNKFYIPIFDKNVLSVYEQPFNKIRIGSKFDCGFVICNDIKSDVLLSYGIHDDFVFENDYINLNKDISCIAFYKSNRVNNNPRILSIENNNITDLFIGKFKNIFFKIDTMGKEIELLKKLSDDYLNNISQIAIKIHLNLNGGFNDEKYEVLKRLSETHYLVHIKGNNYGDLIQINDIILPETIECLYIRKNEVNNPKKILFHSPTNLDNVNTLERPVLKC